MSRLLVFGLDGASFDLILPWAEQGRLPTFNRLLQEGSWAPLRSVPNMNTAPAWTTFMTGKNPGKHGIFWFAEEGEKAGTVRFVTAGDRRARSVWRLLSDAGRKVGVVNLPLTYPAEPVDGVMITGFEAPSPSSPGFTHPPGLLSEIERECGAYVLHASVARHAEAGRLDRVVEDALAAEDSRAAAALHLLRTRPWDVFMHVVKSTDLVCHHAWSYDHPPEAQPWMGPVYEHADALLARFLEAAGPDCGVMIMSDHGTGWRQPAAEFLNDVLEQLGFLARPQRAGGRGAWRRAYRYAKRLGPRAKSSLKRLLPGVYRRFGWGVRFGGIDWSRTRAYCDNTRSCVWVNLKGRNPQGVVEPSAYRALVEQLREMLLALTDPETGSPVVESVLLREETYQGPYTEQAPDMQINWRYDRPVRGLAYEGPLGTARTLRTGGGFMHGLTGAHRPYGVLLVSGPQFTATGRREPVGIEDLAPTILHAQGVPVPADMDGRVLLEFLSEPHASRPVDVGAAEAAADAHETVYSEDEASEVEERLRALGYL